MTRLHALPHTPLRRIRARLLSHLTLFAITFPLSLCALHIHAQIDDEIIEVRTNLVTVPVIVTDRRSQPVAGLTATDFTLFIDDTPVQPALFVAGVERLALAFVLDASGSVREHIARQAQAARTLLDSFPETPRTAVFHFSAQAQLTATFSTDADAIRRSFTNPTRPAGRTAIFDAAHTAIRSFDSLPKRELERRILIVVSDGLDTASAIPSATVINEANRRNISIYVLHLPLYTPRDGRLAPRTPTKGFRDLARLTGGNYYLVGDAHTALNPRLAYDFAPAFNDITADLRSQYVLGFYPPTQTFNASIAANTEHRIKVELTRPNKRKLRLRPLRQTYTLRAPITPPK